VNTNNGAKWRRFIVPKKVEQINDHLFELIRRFEDFKSIDSVPWHHPLWVGATYLFTCNVTATYVFWFSNVHDNGKRCMQLSINCFLWVWTACCQGNCTFIYRKMRSNCPRPLVVSAPDVELLIGYEKVKVKKSSFKKLRSGILKQDVLAIRNQVGMEDRGKGNDFRRWHWWLRTMLFRPIALRLYKHWGLANRSIIALSLLATVSI